MKELAPKDHLVMVWQNPMAGPAICVVVDHRTSPDGVTRMVVLNSGNQYLVDKEAAEDVSHIFGDIPAICWLPHQVGRA